MLRANLSDQEISLLGRAWELSEEAEEAADAARHHLPRTRDIVIRLTHHANPLVRYQAYDVLGDLDENVAETLPHGTQDTDPYARRRAFLAILRRPERMTVSLMDQFLSDPDPYNRGVAIRAGLGSGIADVVGRSRRALERETDPVAIGLGAENQHPE